MGEYVVGLRSQVSSSQYCPGIIMLQKIPQSETTGNQEFGLWLWCRDCAMRAAFVPNAQTNICEAGHFQTRLDYGFNLCLFRTPTCAEQERDKRIDPFGACWPVHGLCMSECQILIHDNVSKRSCVVSRVLKI